MNAIIMNDIKLKQNEIGDLKSVTLFCEVFDERITALTETIQSQEGARLPGARRMENRKRIDIEGVHASDSLLEKIKSYCV